MELRVSYLRIGNSRDEGRQAYCYTQVLTGDGDVIEPDDGVAAIGSGGSYAQAAARALVRHTALPAAEVARSAMEIAAAMCIYTNDQIVLYTLDEVSEAVGGDAVAEPQAQPAAVGAAEA